MAALEIFTEPSNNENKAPEGKPILSEVANIGAQTSMPRAKVTGAGKDEDKEREKQAILSRCKEIVSKIRESTNPAEREGLIAQLNALAAHAEALGIKIDVDKMVSSAPAKENVKAGIAQGADESEERRAAKEAQEAQAREKEWDNDPRRGEWTQAKVEAAYREFDEVNEPRLKKLRKKNAILDDAIRAIDADEPPSAEHKEVLRPKTPEELEQERQHKEDLEKMEKIAAQDHAYHDARHKEVEEKIRELEARKQRHKDAGDHQAAAAVEKEMAPHVHKQKYHVEGKKTAVVKQDTVKGAKEDYEKEEKLLQEVKKRAKKVKKLGWEELVVEHGADGVDKKGERAKIEEIQGAVAPDHAHRHQEEQSVALKPILPAPKELQPQTASPFQQPKDNKEVSSPDHKLDSPKLASSILPVPVEVKKREQGELNPPEVATKGANIINSAKEHATINAQPASAQVKPEGGVGAGKKKALSHIQKTHSSLSSK